MHIIATVEFEWDPRKAELNRSKHGVDFADAVGVFSDPSAITVPDRYRGEQRFVTVGIDFVGRTLVVIYTWRGKAVRLISARRATRGERRQYQG